MDHVLNTESQLHCKEHTDINVQLPDICDLKYCTILYKFVNGNGCKWLKSYSACFLTFMRKSNGTF